MGAWNSGLQQNNPTAPAVRPSGPWGTPGVVAPPGQQAAPQQDQNAGNGGGGIFSRIGGFLKQVMPYVTPIANRLAAAAGNYGPIELEHQQHEENLRQQMANSQLQSQSLQQQLAQKNLENYETPEQRDARALKQAGAITEQQKEFEKPTDVVAPMPEGGMGHYNQKWNPTTKQYETSPTMVPSPPQQNVGGYGPVPSTMPPTTAGLAPQPPQFNPMTGGTQQLPPTAVPSPPHQLPAIQRPLSPAGDTEPDANSPTGFSKIWRGPNFQELHREPTPAPSAYVGSQTQGDTTVYKDDGQGHLIPVQVPHTSTKTPVPPTRPPSAQASAPPTMPGSTPTPTPAPGGSRKQLPTLTSPHAQDWVTWDENGHTVAGPLAMASQSGAQNPAKLPAQEVRDVNNARHAVTLMTKQGDPTKPETNGVLQLIDALDSEGKLGVLASRWNSFMTTGVGSQPGDDPRITTLLDKNMLGDTATMLAHFGASGGRSPQMLQHFLDLANAQKMDGPTLKAGVKAIADYMGDRAMLPGQQKNQFGPPQKVQSFGDWNRSQQPH